MIKLSGVVRKFTIDARATAGPCREAAGILSQPSNKPTRGLQINMIYDEVKTRTQN